MVVHIRRDKFIGFVCIDVTATFTACYLSYGASKPFLLLAHVAFVMVSESVINEVLFRRSPPFSYFAGQVDICMEFSNLLRIHVESELKIAILLLLL